MPELPDVELYVAALRARVVGEPLERIRIASPFFLRSYEPQPAELEGLKITGVSRLGKRIVFALEENHFIVVHLMIAGRFRWNDRGAAVPKKIGLAALDFPGGTLIVTEAGSKKRASMHLVKGLDGLREHDRGGLEPLEIDLERFRDAILSGNHTLKRALTDPRKFSGIGNAYSDEILHAARLSPVRLTLKLTPEEIERLYEAMVEVLSHWTELLRRDAETEFPRKVTAFRPEMAVHGKFGEPCPVCGSEVQRIVYAENETNYCARCQTGGKLLRDRSLSRLLRDDWPRSIDEID